MKPTLRTSAIRYLMVGVASFAIDFGGLVLLHGVLGVYLPVATAVAFLTSVGFNFFLNRMWSFDAAVHPVAGQAVRYGMLVGLNLVLNVLIVSALTAGHLDYRLAKIASTSVVTLVNFTMLRIWVFRQVPA
jgi:putative flippase GtrA